jgi:hypothetical protein
VAWAAAGHFLLVEIAGDEAVVTPIGEDAAALPITAPDGKPVATPFRITI